MPVENVLVVEDASDWIEIYSRQLRPPGRGALRIARSLEEARQVLHEMAFAVAFVDIALDQRDDKNTDGLEVMRSIANLNEGTAIIMVTGLSGEATVPITRDAFKEYGAFETVNKGVRPSELRDLLQGGLVEHDRMASIGRVEEIFRGRMDQMAWDHLIMRTLAVRMGVAPIYAFLNRLFGPFLPAIPRDQKEPVRIDVAARTVAGDFWSRALGRAVRVAFGIARDERDDVGDEPSGNRESSESGGVGAPLRRTSVGSLSGVVWELNDHPRDRFPAT